MSDTLRLHTFGSPPGGPLPIRWLGGEEYLDPGVPEAIREDSMRLENDGWVMSQQRAAK